MIIAHKYRYWPHADKDDGDDGVSSEDHLTIGRLQLQDTDFSRHRAGKNQAGRLTFRLFPYATGREDPLHVSHRARSHPEDALIRQVDDCECCDPYDTISLDPFPGILES